MSGQQDDQVFYRRQDEVEDQREFNDTAQYEGENEIDPGDEAGVRLEDLADGELREGETDDPNIAAEEGLTYVPPVDPPVIPSFDDPQGIEIAAGFGSTGEEEPFDADHESELVSLGDDMEERVREALRADAATSMYADFLVIGTRGRTVVVRGEVDDIDDTDNVTDVIGRVTGVDDVVDELEVRGVTD
ncbi:MAG TPA: BON domain-containing protein [Candidatus Limnocylindrales bacterium]|jgi:hypothetical protein